MDIIARLKRDESPLALDAADEIELLRGLLTQAMALLHQMPVKHPQQAQKRDDLAKRCELVAGFSPKEGISADV